ncbi:hypothetical protein ACIO14_07750 [Nocardia fluminea]|uniref:hypothetical protein n=1 Tax=Nocardia fluminea TaxID=134984 RepID=UPI00382676DB
MEGRQDGWTGFRHKPIDGSCTDPSLFLASTPRFGRQPEGLSDSRQLMSTSNTAEFTLTTTEGFQVVLRRS